MNNEQFRQRYQRRRHNSRQNQQQQPRNNFIAMLIQFFPIIVILSYLLMNPLFMKSQYYSFQRTNKFPHRRVSMNLKIQYFIGDDFYDKYGDNLSATENEIENEYVGLLKENCREEEHHLQNLKMYYSMTWNSREKESLRQRIINYQRPYCNRLNQLIG